MIAVRHCFMTATGPVDVIRIMAKRVGIDRCATLGVRGRNLDDVFFDVVSFLVMKMAIVEIVDMVSVAYSGMAAVRSMYVAVVRVAFVVAGHEDSPFLSKFAVVSSAA